MSSMGLLSGSADRAQRLSQLLKDAGADPMIITDPAALPGDPGGDGLDFYIQLPVTIHPDGDTAVARVGSFLSAGLLARFSAVDRVLPVLAPGATVDWCRAILRLRRRCPTTSSPGWRCSIYWRTRLGRSWRPKTWKSRWSAVGAAMRRSCTTRWAATMRRMLSATRRSGAARPPPTRTGAPR